MVELLGPSKVWDFIILGRKEELEMEAEKGRVGPKTQAGITTSNEAGVMRGGVEKEGRDPKKKQAAGYSLASFQFQEIQETWLRFIKCL